MEAREREDTKQKRQEAKTKQRPIVRQGAAVAPATAAPTAPVQGVVRHGSSKRIYLLAAL